MLNAVEFLRRVALGDRHLPGKRVAIVGGGNVAIDAARTCIRLGCEAVTMVYRRSRAEMPAHEEEIHRRKKKAWRSAFLPSPKKCRAPMAKLTGAGLSAG